LPSNTVCASITGDNYGAEWVAGSVRDAGGEYRQAKLVRSELYLAGLPLFTRGVVSIPPLAQMLRELRLLERRTHRSGKDVVDHGVGGSDDYANALFGALHLAASVVRQPTSFPAPLFFGTPRRVPGGMGIIFEW
jgi:hypothetical protein